MKCPKCNYTSFDYLDSCRKCGADLRDVRGVIQIIAVPPEEKAPTYPRPAEQTYASDLAPAETNKFLEGDVVPTDLDGEESEQELLSGLNFDQSFDQLVEGSGEASQQPVAAPPDDGLLDLDFGNVFAESAPKAKG